MKKVLPGLICLFLISCGLEIPESLTVKGKPGLYVPLGSPFANRKEEEKLEYYISPDNIKKMMNDRVSGTGADNEIKIYDYKTDDNEVQTYLTHYPLVEMPLKLEKYADKAMKALSDERHITIPETPADLPDGLDFPLYINGEGKLLNEEDIDDPFLKIPLDDMAKLVKKVDGKKFGLQIGNTGDLERYLEISIPAFGFDYMHGIVSPDAPGKLQYYDETDAKTTFYPQRYNDKGPDLSNGELWVYARISGPCEGKITPTIIFDWEEALIDTSTAEDIKDISTFTGEYPIKNNLSEFMGKGITFKRVDGFMYMSGVKVGAGSIFTGFYDSHKPDSFGQIRKLKNEDIPRFQDGETFRGELYPMSILDDENYTGPIDLTGALTIDNAILQYAIIIEDMTIYSATVNDQYIKFDLVVMIPLDLKVSGEVDPDAPENIRNNYVKLDFRNSFTNLGEGDLFGRKKGGENNILNEIDYVRIFLRYVKGVDITIMDPDRLAILVETNKTYSLLRFSDIEPALIFSGDSLNPIPFSPAFHILLERDQVENTGSFTILRSVNPKFDFRLHVEGKARIDYTLEF